MELAQLEAFLEVVQWGSFRRAAKALFLSQPALSERIKKLEEEVDQGLFERVGNGVRLTQAGRTLLPYAERTMETLRQGREAVQAAKPASGGALLIASARTVGTYVLPDIVVKFRQRFPVDVHISSGRSTEVLQMVLNQDAHIGVARALTHPQLETVPLYQEKVVLVTHPDHRFAIQGKASITEVAHEPLILYDRDSFYFLLIERACRESGITPRVHMMLDSIEATKQMVERGLGISFLPLSAIRKEVLQGTIARVPLAEGHTVTLDTAAILMRRVPHSPAVRAFLALLQEELTPAAAALA